MIDLLNKESILQTNFPQDKIILLNGKTLTCYPKTDSYQSQNTQQDKEEEIFFIEHAYFFLNHVDAIFNDSRMFLAPVSAHNGLAYTGGSCLRNATLGVYLEWWIYGEDYNKKDREGNDALTCIISGSPLSGANSCYGVCPDGTKKTIRNTSFGYLWRSFCYVNSRYRDAYSSYESYTLREVYDILIAAEENEDCILRTQLLISEGKVSSLTTKLSHLTERYDNLREKYDQLCILHSQSKLQQLSDEYNKRAEDVANQIADLNNQRRSLKARLKSGELTNIEYQKLLHPINRQCNDLDHSLWQYANDQTMKLVSEDSQLTENLVRKYLYEHAIETSRSLS